VGSVEPLTCVTKNSPNIARHITGGKRGKNIGYLSESLVINNTIVFASYLRFAVAPLLLQYGQSAMLIEESKAASF
jgi:hypothetical protein